MNTLLKTESEWTQKEAFDSAFARSKICGFRFSVKKSNGVWRVVRLQDRWCEQSSQVHKRSNSQVHKAIRP